MLLTHIKHSYTHTTHHSNAYKQFNNTTQHIAACTVVRLRNDLYCVEWGVKLYSLTHSLVR